MPTFSPHPVADGHIFHMFTVVTEQYIM